MPPLTTPLYALQHLLLAAIVLPGMLPSHFAAHAPITAAAAARHKSRLVTTSQSSPRVAREIPQPSESATRFPPPRTPPPTPAAPSSSGNNGSSAVNDFGRQYPPTYEQRVALAEIRLAVDEAGSELESWDSDVAWIYWLGIECDEQNQVIKISLSGNELKGNLPISLSRLQSLQHLDIRGNQLSGTLTSAIGTLTALTFLDLSNNKLNGSLPEAIGQLENLRHLDLHQNPITGSIPAAIGRLANLTRLDLHGIDFELAPLPTAIGRLLQLYYLDLSYTQATGTLPKTFSQLQSLRFLSLDGNQLEGPFGVIQRNSSLEVVQAGHNRFTGAVPDVSWAPNLRLLSLHDNNFTGPVPLADLNSTTTNVVLAGNPLCTTALYYRTCNVWQQRRLCTLPCPPSESPSPMEYLRARACVCAVPLVVQLFMRNPSYTLFNDEYAERFQTDLAKEIGLDGGQIWLDNVNQREDNFEVATVRLYPFNASSPWTSEQKQQLYRDLGQVTQISPIFGRVAFDGPPPPPAPNPPPPPVTFAPSNTSNTFPIWAIVVTAAGLLSFVASLLLLMMWLRRERRRQMLKPVKSMLTLRVQEHFVRPISFADIKSATANFSEDRLLGAGGYGSVYKGDGPNGEQWAVKRAQVTTVHSLNVFQNEVDVISSMSHRNLIGLLGYCEDHGEQILVYEFAENGALCDVLRPKAGTTPLPPSLSLQQRVEVALGAAQGLFYLHSFARPPVIHRDVKSGNILLDHELQAKVADFGLLKPSKGEGAAHSTQVAGTPGYLDPEYYSVFKVTAKSDVYSFGVVLLEIITGLPPIFESPDPNESTDGEKQMTSLSRWCAPYVQTGNVSRIVDPRIPPDYPVDVTRGLADVAMACVQRHSKNRPDMGEVVRRLGDILSKLTGDENAGSLGHLLRQGSGLNGTGQGGGACGMNGITIPEDAEIDPNIALVANMQGNYDESTVAMSQIIPR